MKKSKRYWRLVNKKWTPADAYALGLSANAQTKTDAKTRHKRYIADLQETFRSTKAELAHLCYILWRHSIDAVLSARLDEWNDVAQAAAEHDRLSKTLDDAVAKFAAEAAKLGAECNVFRRRFNCFERLPDYDTPECRHQYSHTGYDRHMCALCHLGYRPGHRIGNFNAYHLFRSSFKEYANGRSPS